MCISSRFSSDWRKEDALIPMKNRDEALGRSHQSVRIDEKSAEAIVDYGNELS